MPGYGTHRTLGAGEEASGGSPGDWDVETGAVEAPGGRWPGAPQALVGEGMTAAVIVAPLLWREGWQENKNQARGVSSRRLSHGAGSLHRARTQTP